jgi:hypothetical protein
VTALVDENIGRLQVAMDDPSGVRSFETVSDVNAQRKTPGSCKCLILLASPTGEF